MRSGGAGASSGLATAAVQETEQEAEGARLRHVPRIAVVPPEFPDTPTTKLTLTVLPADRWGFLRQRDDVLVEHVGDRG